VAEDDPHDAATRDSAPRLVAARRAVRHEARRGRLLDGMESGLITFDPSP
jgi:hypothetical protein